MKNRCRVTFRAVYHDGELSAVSYDDADREVGRDVLHSAGEQTELRLEPETETCAPGEMVYFRMRYTDEAGEGKPMEKHCLSVAAENGTVMGAVNGSCSFKGNFAQSKTPTYFGEAQTIVQAGESGILTVSVTDGVNTVTKQLTVL